MTRIAYLDATSGISGDMFIAALLDAGLGEQEFLEGLRTIAVGPFDFKRSRVLRSGLAGAHIEFVAPGQQRHRHLSHVEKLINESELPPRVKARALVIFGRLAEAEGKLHAKPPGEVHFHEVGAVDAILDIAGACLGIELLGIEELHCSPLNVGAGRVDAAHGSLPVPAPATVELLKGLPVFSSGIDGELVTPTGAAIVATLAEHFGPMPHMTIAQTGYGAGSRDFPGHPNLARIVVGERAAVESAADDTISVIQANVDDMSPQLFSFMMDRALAAGALDVTCRAIQMKKNRPGLEITVLCRPEDAETMAHILFEQTTTLGARIHEERRRVLDREFVSVETRYGKVRVKVAKISGQIVNAAPEYDECRRIAEEKLVPLKEVMAEALAAYRQQEAEPKGAPSEVIGRLGHPLP